MAAVAAVYRRDKSADSNDGFSRCGNCHLRHDFSSICSGAAIVIAISWPA